MNVFFMKMEPLRGRLLTATYFPRRSSSPKAC